MKRALLVLVAACGHHPAAAPPPPADAAPGCTAEAFPDSIPVPEASGAAFTQIGGHDALVVVADSGNGGAYLAIDPESGKALEDGKLPLGQGASDDVEGFAADGDSFLGVTSSGWVRRWQRGDHGFVLVDGPYPLGAVDKTLRDNPPAGGLMEPHTDSLACDGPSVNCGKNYESLCLVPAARRTPRACVGWAGAKADGALLCLVADGARLTIDPSRTIAVVAPGAMSDCAIDDDGTIWVLTNGFDGGIYRIVDGKPVATPIGPWGFPEAMVVRGPEAWRFTDNGGAPSPAQRWRCLLRSP